MPHPIKPWTVIPTGNAAGDLAICNAGQTKPVNRIATVPVRPGHSSHADAATIAAAPEALGLLHTIKSDGLLDIRESGSKAMGRAIDSVIEKAPQ